MTDDTDTTHLGSASGKFVQCDSLAGDAQYAQLGDSGGAAEVDLGATGVLGFQSPTEEETKDSPTSADDALSIGRRHEETMTPDKG